MTNDLADAAVLRDRHRQARAALCTEQQQHNAQALANNIAQVTEFVDCGSVASYIAIRGEIDTWPLMESYADNNYYLPVLRGHNMHFAPWTVGAPLVKKSFGLLEPDCSEQHWLHPAELDVVLVPLVVFDHHCNRVGQGGGFYDRTFEFLKQRSGVGKPVLLGVAHDCQREPLLQTQSWDVPLDFVVTESAVYPRR